MKTKTTPKPIAKKPGRAPLAASKPPRLGAAKQPKAPATAPKRAGAARALGVAREAIGLTGSVCALHRAGIYDLLAAGRRAGEPRRVGSLALASAERVLPYFTRARPKDRRAAELLALARDVLASDDAAALAAARDRAGDAFHELAGLAPPAAAAAGLAAVFAVLEAAGDEPFGAARADFTEATPDDALDPESGDAARYAAAACLHGENGAEASYFGMAAVKARMAFWADWLARAEALAGEGASPRR